MTAVREPLNNESKASSYGKGLSFEGLQECYLTGGHSSPTVYKE